MADALDFAAVSVENAQVMRALDQFDKKVRAKIERRGLRVASKPVLASARRLVPIAEEEDVHDADHTPGTLQRSLRVRALKRSGARRRMGIYGVAVQAGKESHMFKGDEFYGAFPEFGTVRQAAQHFMAAAADENRAVVPSLWRQEVRRYIEEIRSV